MAGLSLTQMIVLAFFTSCAVFMHLFACALYENWFPLLVLIPYVLTPLPHTLYLLFNNDNDSLMSSSSGSSSALHWAEFMCAFFATGIFAIPSLLLNVSLIEGGALGMSISGTVLVFVTIALYHFYAREDKEILGGGGFRLN